MNDYSYPSIYFSYFLFFLLMGGAVYFMLRTLRQGYFGKGGEAPKYRMLSDD